MRHKAAEEQMTRLLITKPAAYAELDENVRIAVSVLQDDGWAVERVGLDFTFDVTVTTQAISRPNAVQLAESAISQANDQLFTLRRMLIAKEADAWLAASVGFILGEVVFQLGWGILGCVFPVVCAGPMLWLRIKCKRKGAA
jgi:hypothetical protein